MNKFRSSLRTAGALFALLVALSVGVAQFGSSKENSTLVRNSFLLEGAVSASDLEIPPNATPKSFLRELRTPPREYSQLGQALNAQQDSASTTLDRAQAIAAHLIANKIRGRPIQSTVAAAYAAITEKGLGYCADYSQVFVALALAQGIEVREWGLGFGRLGSGHAFNEFFDPKLGKWIFIDSYHSFYVTDAISGVPLSVVEFQQRLLDPSLKASVSVEKVRGGNFRFESNEEAINYYDRGKHFFYVFWGNNVFSYDAHPVVKRLGAISRTFEVLGAIAAGVHPKIRVVGTTENETAVRELRTLKWLMFAALLLAALLFLALIFQGLKLRRLSVNTGKGVPASARTP